METVPVSSSKKQGQGGSLSPWEESSGDYAFRGRGDGRGTGKLERSDAAMPKDLPEIMMHSIAIF